MLHKRKVFGVAVFMLFTLTTVTLVPIPAQQAGEEAAVQPESGYFFYAGGPAKAKRARTQTAVYTFGETAGWINLPGATLQYPVSAGTSDLFNVAFSAECRLINSIPPNDYLRIRIADTVGGVTTFLEPYDGGQAFCSANGYATHKGNWVRRAGSGVHTLQVQFWIFSPAGGAALTAWIDDWTFELVVYD